MNATENKKNILQYRKTIRIDGEKIEKTFTRKSDAEKWYQKKKQEKEYLDGGLKLKEADTILSNFALSWLDKRKKTGQPFSSWSSDEGRLRKYILPAFGHRTFSKISTKEWENFFDGLVEKEIISPSTRNRIRSLVTKMYNDAMRLELLSNNPIRIIPKLQEPMDAWDYWISLDEILSYLDAAKNESYSFYVFASLSLNLGCRVGEALALDHSDINLSQRQIHIHKVFEEASGEVCKRTKGHKPRWLGINDSLRECLVEYGLNTRFKKQNDPLICDADGKRLYERQIRRIHERVCKKAEIKLIRIHDMRHTYASHYIMNGGTLADLQSLLGHSSPIMTAKYAHMAPGYLEKKASIVSFALPKSNVTALKRVK